MHDVRIIQSFSPILFAIIPEVSEHNPRVLFRKYLSNNIDFLNMCPWVCVQKSAVMFLQQTVGVNNVSLTFFWFHLWLYNVQFSDIQDNIRADCVMQSRRSFWWQLLCNGKNCSVIVIAAIDVTFSIVLLTLKVLVVTIDAQWEGMGDVVSVRYEPALLPPCPTIWVLSYSN